MKGIIGSVITTVIAYLIINLITHGAATAWLGVIAFGASLGLITGAALVLTERFVNGQTILNGSLITTAIWLLLAVPMALAFATPVVNLIVPTLVFAGIGAIAGWGFRYGSRY
jgi:hypothetical protein